MARVNETLARMPLFAALPRPEIDALDTRCIWRRYDPGAEILGWGDAGTDVFHIVSGTVRAAVLSTAEREIIFRDLGPGDLFGEMAAIDGAVRSASIVALTATVAAKMPAHVLREVFHRHPAVAEAMMRLLVARVRNLSDRVTELSAYTVKNRLYRELLRLGRPDGAGRDSLVISPPPFQHDLAARIGSHREAVSREIKALERDGLIERRRGALVIVDPQGLQARIDDDGRQVA